jgi:ribosomal protein S18 acetylase RimI-like enzyme
MSEGAIAGSFSDAFIERTGSVKLLWTILRSVVAQNFQNSSSGRRYEWQIIVRPTGHDVGFLKLSQGPGPAQNLELVAVHAEYRNQGIGTAVVEHITSRLPEGAQLTVHCTKYARAMQHILKKYQIWRSPTRGIPIRSRRFVGSHVH